MFSNRQKEGERIFFSLPHLNQYADFTLESLRSVRWKQTQRGNNFLSLLRTERRRGQVTEDGEKEGRTSRASLNDESFPFGVSGATSFDMHLFNGTSETDLIDRFPSSYEDEQPFESIAVVNRSYYFDETMTTTTRLTSLSSPFTSILTILIVYLLLTIILLAFSLYKQRQTEMENFYFGETDEEIEQGKRHAAWKRFLIGRIRKGDMRPLLLLPERTADTRSFPSNIV